MRDESTDKTFFTNDSDGSLLDRFKKTLKHIKNFDVLVGYFRTSGFYLLYKELEKVKNIRILNGIDVDKKTFQAYSESQKSFNFENTSTLKERLSNEFQKVMFARQASCINDDFLSTFSQHFEEELGHDELLMQRDNINTEKDAVLIASSSWFVWQMFVRDNIEKVVLVHLVLELSGDYYHEIAKGLFSDDVSSDYFSIHAEADEFHALISVFAPRLSVPYASPPCVFVFIG